MNVVEFKPQNNPKVCLNSCLLLPLSVASSDSLRFLSGLSAKRFCISTRASSASLNANVALSKSEIPFLTAASCDDRFLSSSFNFSCLDREGPASWILIQVTEEEARQHAFPKVLSFWMVVTGSLLVLTPQTAGTLPIEHLSS